MRFILTQILLFSFFMLSAQTLDEARELYKAGKFKQALPIFEKEYNEKPTDPALNQWYGVCIYETGGDLNKAEQLISFADKKNVQDASLYLGNIYTKIYRFADAEREYEKYAKLKKKDKEALAKLEKQKEYMSGLMKIALNPEDIQIIDSIVVNKADFLSVYRLSTNAGKLEEFKNVFDTNVEIKSTVYFNEKGSKIYFAQLSEGVYSLFSMEKLLDGFGNEKKLSANNFGLSGNLNYPFVLSDGVTIYFSAEDKNGLGGYDLYVTRYNTNNDTYLNPERLAMPFNSLANDYMMVIDEEKGIGWFASDRFQDKDKVCVYTFIPNSKVEIVENESNEYKFKRARITSIKDSWREGKDYMSLINLSKKKAEVKAEVIKDFEFVINDKYTYYTYSEFKNEGARDIYYNANEKARSLENLERELDKKRAEYSKASNGDKSKITPTILQLEQQQELLFKEVEDLRIKARNEEIKNLTR